MLRLDRVIKPWKEAAALTDHINLYGFWNETTFLTKSGDLGTALRVSGVDYESFDHAEQEYAVKRLESALKAFGPGFHVYQYLFKQNRPEIPFAHYDDPVVEAAIDQRRRFFESKRDHLYQIEIYYCIVLEGPRSKTGVGAALARLFRDPAGAVGELRAQFTNNCMKTLLRSQIEHDRARLDQRVQAFYRQLADFVQIEVMNQEGQFHFFRRLLNYDDWRIAGKPQSTQFLDYQVVNSNIEAERDHLRVGDHVVRVLTMKEAITETRPLVLDALLKIPGNFYVVTEWTPLAGDKARKEVNKRRRHFNMSKTGFVSQMGNDASKTNPRDVLVDESKQADIENLGDCLRALGDGQSLGDFSLTIVLYGKSKSELDQLVGEFAGIFTNADGNLFAETYNQLNAYFATIPGNYALNLRKLYLLNTNYADLSFLFTILPGETKNAHLGTEYLAALETDNATPYFLNLHNGEVAHTLILGMTGSGKSYFANFLLQNAQKYAPLTFIFDIGGSFQSLTTIFGGSYLNVGQEARDFTINPFSLPPTKDNLQFLFSFFRVLIEGSEQRYRLDFKEERRLWDAIERCYMLELDQRTVSNFGNIIGELKERLHRWTRGGQYGFLFDNAEDTLSFSRFQTFNFAGWGDAPDVLEPLLFYVLHRASNEIGDPNKLATFKVFLLDEAWLFIKNETIRNYVVSAQKTWRKHNAAMVLANNVADLKSQLEAEQQKEQQNALAATAAGDPALANATPAQRAAAAGYTPAGLPVGCVPGQPCAPQNGYPPQQGSGAGQLSAAQQAAQQLAVKERERADNARFSSNIAYTRPAEPLLQQQGQNAPTDKPTNPYLAAGESNMVATRATGEQPPQTKPRAPEINIDSASGQPYVIYEGMTLDTVLMNRLDGDAVGPVKVLVSNPVYSHDHQHVLIPDGTIVLGEAKKIGAAGFGQQRRMTVAFHRMIMPDGYSVDLDQFHGLDQIGEEGLKDKVNNHYLEIFGTSIALGIIAGASEIEQGGGAITTSGSQAFTSGAASSVSQSATTILDRFMQIPPTITIREGHRVKVYFTQDMLLPAYTNHTIPQTF